MNGFPQVITGGFPHGLRLQWQEMREQLRQMLTDLCLNEKIRYMQGLHEALGWCGGDRREMHLAPGGNDH